MIDSCDKKEPVVVSVQSVKYEVCSGTIGSLSPEEQQARNYREHVFDATGPTDEM